jgi:hypothetical protein
VDRGKAIASFLNHFEQLARLPLITDQEMKNLYGDEIELAILEMDRLNQENQLCLNCDRNCCQEYSCEFFAPQFGWCPVFHIRPVICRIHFCQRFQPAACLTIMELYDIFLDSLDIAAKSGSTKVGLFEIPPFISFAPQLISAIAPLVQAVREGNLDPENGRQQILLQAMRYRMASQETTGQSLL